MLVSLARTICRTAATQATPQAYPNENVDIAIQYAGHDALLLIPSSETLGTVALNATAVTFSVTALSNFFGARVMRCSIGNYVPVQQVTYDTIIDQLASPNPPFPIGTTNPFYGTAGTNTPTQVAFYADNTSIAGEPTKGLLNVTPGTNYPVMTVFYRQGFVGWTPGDSAAGTVVMNVPDYIAYSIAFDGASAALQMNDPNARFGSVAWQRYEAWKKRMAGRSGNDVGVDISNPRAYV